MYHGVQRPLGGSNVLNLSFSELGSVDFWDSSVVLTAIVCRAFGGSSERKSRAERAFGENGLNRVVTSVMNFVIILGGCGCSTGGACISVSVFARSPDRRLQAGGFDDGEEGFGSETLSLSSPLNRKLR